MTRARWLTLQYHARVRRRLKQTKRDDKKRQTTTL